MTCIRCAFMAILRSLGVDPGLAYTGIAAIERTEDGRLVSRGVRLVHTEPRHDKRQRVTADDERRIREIFDAVAASAVKFEPNCISIENYTVYGEKDIAGLKTAARNLVNFVLAFGKPEEILTAPKNLDRFVKMVVALKKGLDVGSEYVGGAGRGKAAKTLSVYGACLTVGWVRKIPVFINMPVDLKLRFLKRAKGSKEEVEHAVCALVEGLQAHARERVNPSMQNHVFDAAGHGVLGIYHLEEVTGVRS